MNKLHLFHQNILGKNYIVLFCKKYFITGECMLNFNSWKGEIKHVRKECGLSTKKLGIM